jgi:hypothetical protein
MRTLQELQDWYADQCNGTREHTYGISIGTLDDNPGWLVKIDLAQTNLSNSVFPPRSKETSESDWLRCSVTDNVFNGAGDPTKLETILRIFLDWSKSTVG